MSEANDRWECCGTTWAVRLRDHEDWKLCPKCGKERPRPAQAEAMSEDEHSLELGIALIREASISQSRWGGESARAAYDVAAKARELLAPKVDRNGLEHAIESALGKTEDGTVTGEQTRAIVDTVIAYLGVRPADVDVAKLREELVQSRRLQVEAAQLAGCAMQERDEQRARAEKLTCDLAELRVELDALHSDYELQAAQVGRADKEMAELRSRAERAEADLELAESQIDELAEARRQPAQGGLPKVGETVELSYAGETKWHQERVDHVGFGITGYGFFHVTDEGRRWRRVPQPVPAVEGQRCKDHPLHLESACPHNMHDNPCCCRTDADKQAVAAKETP